MANNERQNTREDELGALWLKRKADGEPYFTGSISLDGGATKVGVVVFKNRHKNAETHPDYRILKSKPKAAPKPDDYPFANVPPPITDDDNTVTDDMIPF